MVKRDARALAPVAGLLDAYRDPQGRLYGPPLPPVCAARADNRALFDRFGVKYPDESLEWNPRDGGTFLDLARRLTRPADEVFGWWFSGQATADTLGWLKQHNGAWLDRARTRADMLRPELLQAFEWMSDLVNRHGVSPKPADAPLQDNARGGRHWLFLRGKAAMFNLLLGQELAWSRETLDQSAGLVRVGVAPLPRGMRRAVREHQPPVGHPGQHRAARRHLGVRQVVVQRPGHPGGVLDDLALRPAGRAQRVVDPRVLQPRADRPLDVRPFIDPGRRATPWGTRPTRSGRGRTGGSPRSTATSRPG